MNSKPDRSKEYLKALVLQSLHRPPHLKQAEPKIVKKKIVLNQENADPNFSEDLTSRDKKTSAKPKTDSSPLKIKIDITSKMPKRDTQWQTSPKKVLVESPLKGL